MEEIKQYIDEKFELIYKILKVCKKCYKGTYQPTGSACYPPQLACYSCGDIYCDNNPIKKNQQISLACVPAKPPQIAASQLAPTILSDEEMLYGLYD